MKNIPHFFCLLLFASLGWSGCAVNQEDNATMIQKNQELPIVHRQPGIYPDSIRLYDIVAKYPNSTWRDLDAYYKNDISKYHSNQDYTDNLRKLAIVHLVNTFDLINAADKQTIEYYTHEQMTVPIVNTEVFVKCLQGLKGYWSDERIKSTALSEYDRLIDYVINHMKDPEGVLQRHKNTFDKLKNFGEKYPAN